MESVASKSKVEKSLNQLLTTAFVSLSLSILFLAGGLQFFFYFHSETKGLHSQQQLIAEGAASAVGDFIQEKIQALQATAGLNNPDTMKPEEWNLTLQRLLGLETALRTLALVDIHHEPIACVSRFSPSRLDMLANGLNAVRYPQSNSHTPSVSEVYIDPQTSEPIVSLRVPVTNALREPRGLLIAELNLKFIWDLVDQLKVGRTGYVYVVDQSGRLIAFGDTARVLKGENVSHLPPVVESRGHAPNPPRDRSCLYKGLTGTYVLGTFALMDASPWAIIAEIPWLEAYHEVLRTAAISMIIIGIMAFLAAMLGGMVSRKLTIPLADLKETAVRIARGERTLKASVSGPAEVARLATAFNSMASQLVGSLKEIEYQYEEIKIARDAHQESETRLRLALEGTTDGIWDWNIDTGQTYLSPRWYTVLGYEPDQFPASIDRWSALVHHEDRSTTEDVFRRAIDSHEAFAIELRMLAKDGQWRWVLMRGKVVETTADARAVRVAGSLTDISRQKDAELERAELETKYIQAQKMESIGRLAGGVAHDFNNMLAVILGRAELGMMELQPTDPLYQNLHEILTVGKRSAALTRQLLGFARKQTIEPRVLNLNDTIEEMLRLLRRLTGENIDLRWNPDPSLWPVRMDPAQIDQILANLLVNARDAIADVGKVTIETHNTTLDEAYCSSHPGFLPGDFATLTVSDNGCGMEKKTLASIFEPFFTTKQLGHGTGLGLATVYGIVKQNKGFINAYSEPDMGSSFKLYLPRHHSEAVVTGKPVEPPRTQRGSETILLVEDEESLLETATTMLRELGYNVLPADGPLSAIRLAEEHNAPIHLMMTDVIMPDMNARELQRYLSDLQPKMKCLFMSGYTANVIAHQGILDEGLHFINKPFSIQGLAAKLRSILDAP